jgi:hypothetical protein
MQTKTQTKRSQKSNKHATTLSNAIKTLSQHTGLSKAQLMAMLQKPIARQKTLNQEQQKKRANPMAVSKPGNKRKVLKEGY